MTSTATDPAGLVPPELAKACPDEPWRAVPGGED